MASVVVSSLALPYDGFRGGKPMKLSAIFAVVASGALSVVIACSSSSSGGSSSLPQCQGMTGSTGPGSAACNSCLQSNCGSQVSTASGACSAYNSCYSSCQCMDINCLTNCFATKVDANCANGGGTALATCQMNNCSSQCNITVTIGDSGATE
jgi:hypothetical protein